MTVLVAEKIPTETKSYKNGDSFICLLSIILLEVLGDMQ